MKKKVMLCILALGCSIPFCASQLSLDSLFRLAEAESVELQMAMSGIASADEQVKETRNKALPSIGVDLNVGYLGNGVINSERDWNSANWQTVENPHLSNSIAVRASQVIYAGGAIKSEYNLAKLDKEMATLNMASHRQDVRFMIAGYYLDLQRLSNQEQVLEENLHLMDTLLSSVRARVLAGASLSSDITRYELQQETLRLQLQRVLDAKTKVSHHLMIMLHLDEPVTPEKTEYSQVHMQSLNYWEEESSRQNTGLQQASLGVKMQDEAIRLTRSALIPKIAVVAENKMYGPVVEMLPGDININYNYWFVGVGLQYDLSSTYKATRSLKKAKINKATAQYERDLAAEQLYQATHACYIDYLTAEKEILTQEKSVQLAVENYDIVRYRYEQGLALLTDMLDASTTRLSAELALVNAQIQTQYNYYKLLYISSSL